MRSGIQSAVDSARAQGLTGDALVTAVAIAGAESGWRLDAHGDVDIGGSWGPWQIYIPAHPQYTPEWLTASWDNNASAMFEISGGGTNWAPWSTYNNGAYRTYLGDAEAAVQDAGGAGYSDNTGTSADAQIAKVLEFANAQLGKPYVYGGNGPDGWDCSGLTKAAYATIGIDLPRTADLQALQGVDVGVGAIAPGDLVFKFGDGVDFGHVGIAIGNGQFINAPRTGDVVKIAPLPDNIQGVRRIVTGSRKIGGGIMTAIPNPANAVDSVKDAAAQFVRGAKWIADPDNILRILQVISGSILAFYGIAIMAQNSSKVQGIITEVSKAAAA